MRNNQAGIIQAKSASRSSKQNCALPKYPADEAGFLSLVWFEALEPRLLFSATQATLQFDRHFGNEGQATLRFSNDLPSDSISGFDAMAAGPHGTFYAATIGTFSANGASDLQLARFTKGGVLDSSFGLHGVSTIFNAQNNAYIRSGTLLPQADGKIILISEWLSSEPFGAQLIIQRLDKNCLADLGFGDQGRIEIDNYGYVDSLNAAVGFHAWIEPDGKLEVLYNTYNNVGLHDPATGYLLERWNPDGTPDGSFGKGGMHGVDFGLNFDQPYLAVLKDAAQLPDGSIVAYVNGLYFDPTVFEGVTDIFQITLNAGGDTLSKHDVFTNNVFQQPLFAQPNGMAIIPTDHKILQRIGLDGKPDSAFGADGFVNLAVPTPVGVTLSTDQIIVEPDGNLLVVTDYYAPDPSNSSIWVDFGLQQLNPNGTPRHDFAGGEIAFGLSGVYDRLHGDINRYYAYLPLPDGSIIVNGDYDSLLNTPTLKRIAPGGGSANSDDLAIPLSGDPSLNDSQPGDPLNGAGMLDNKAQRGNEAGNLNLFTQTLGTDLFHPNGTGKIFSDGALIS